MQRDCLMKITEQLKLRRLPGYFDGYPFDPIRD
jgi:hypothetical protein